MTDRFRPDAALRGITPPADRGLNRRGDRLLIDDPHCKPGGVTDEERARAFDNLLTATRDAFSPSTYHSEVNKDRTGKHGSEVA